MGNWELTVSLAPLCCSFYSRGGNVWGRLVGQHVHPGSAGRVGGVVEPFSVLQGQIFGVFFIMRIVCVSGSRPFLAPGDYGHGYWWYVLCYDSWCALVGAGRRLSPALVPVHTQYMYLR